MTMLPAELEPRRDAIHDRVIRRGTARRRARRLGSVATVALVLVVAAGVVWIRVDSTTGTTARLSGQVIVAATSRADTARFDTIFEIGSGKDQGRGEVSGSVDFSNPRGDETIRTLPAASTSTPPSAGSASTEIRWIGDDYYTSAASGGAASGPSWTVVHVAKVYAASSCLAKKLNVGAILSGSGGVSPFDVLDTLRKHGTDLERVGTDTIDGVTTTHWHVAFTGPSTTLCDPRDNIDHTKARGSLDIYTDGQSRARRVAVSSTDTTTFPQGNPLTETFTQTTDFSDFGVPVFVQAPPADQTTDQTAAFIAEWLGAGSVRPSSWHEGAHGTFDGSAWKIETARTTTGWNCYDLSDTPNSSGPPGISVRTNGFPQHNGHSTSFLVAGGQHEQISGPVGLFINTTSSSQRLIVGAVTGTGATTLVFKDGSVQHLNVDPNTLMFNWSGAANRIPVRIRIGGQSCRVDNQNQPVQPDWALNTNSACQQWAS